jgi:type I restriction enzyme, S subunit
MRRSAVPDETQGSERAALHVPGFAKKPSEWTWARLDDVCEGVFDCPHSTPVLASAGPFVARSQDVRTGVFRAEQAATVGEQTYAERIARAEPRVGDLLFSREGTYFGIAAEVPPNTRLCLGQRMVLIRAQPNVLNHRYLRYWLNSATMAGHVDGFREGSVAERLNMPVIRSLPVLVPPPRTQRAIAQVLERRSV